MRWVALAIWVVAAFASGVYGAYGQMLCVDRVEMFDRLASEYGEELVEVKEGDQGLLEVLRSYQSGTWTLLLTGPIGITCVVATGEGLSIDEDLLESMEYML